MSSTLSDILNEFNNETRITWHTKPNFEFKAIEIKKIENIIMTLSVIWCLWMYQFIIITFIFSIFKFRIPGFLIENITSLPHSYINIAMILPIFTTIIFYFMGIKKAIKKVIFKRKAYQNCRRIGQKPTYKWVK